MQLYTSANLGFPSQSHAYERSQVALNQFLCLYVISKGLIYATIHFQLWEILNSLGFWIFFEEHF